MPTVGKTKYPYTKKGKADASAQETACAKRKKVVSEYEKD